MGGYGSKQRATKDKEVDKEEPIDINVEWNCGECTYLNKAGTIECSVCGFKRVLVKKRRAPPPPNSEDLPEQSPEKRISLIEEKVTRIMNLQDAKNIKNEEDKGGKGGREEDNDINGNNGNNEGNEDKDNKDDNNENDNNDNINGEEKEEEEETTEQHKKRLQIINELLLREQIKLDEVSGPEIRERRKELTKKILKRMEENDKIVASLK